MWQINKARNKSNLRFIATHDIICSLRIAVVDPRNPSGAMVTFPAPGKGYRRILNLNINKEKFLEMANELYDNASNLKDNKKYE